jgi:heme exporter protein A
MNDLTPCEHLRFWQGLAQNRRVAFLDDILDRAGLQDSAHKRSALLSAGQRQRLALCRLLVEDAKLWLLDEPLSALDDSGEAFLNLLLEKHRSNGGGAVIASHHAIPGAEPYTLRDAA